VQDRLRRRPGPCRTRRWLPMAMGRVRPLTMRCFGPKPCRPGDSAAPNTALHHGQHCVLSLLWQARESVQALPQAEAQRRATSKTACMLW
jgi:hypothetical protein